MKLKHLFTICMATVAIAASAQGYKDGVEYYRADQLANAKTLLERNLNNPETDKAEANYYLGMIAYYYNEDAKAKKYFDAGIAEDPSFALNYVGLGQLELKNKNLKGAESQFKLAEKHSKKDEVAFVKVAIARAYFDVDPAVYSATIEKYIEQAHKKNMKEPDIYLLEGDIEANKGNWGSAGGKYEMAIGYNPQAAEGYVKYAKLFKDVNPKYGIIKLEELVNTVPQSALGQRELALAYYNQQQYDKAANQYGRYVKNPNHFKEDEDRYALLLYSNDEFQKGYDFATALLKTDPNNFNAQRFQYINAAKIPAMENQMLSLSDALYNKHKADPKKYTFAPIDYSLLSYYYKNADRTNDAIAVLQEGIKEMPDNASFPETLANIYFDKDEYTKAADVYAGYVDKRKDPQYGELLKLAIYSNTGGIDARSKENGNPDKYFDTALKALDKAIEMNPDIYNAYKIKGDVLVQKLRDENAAVEPYTIAADKLAAIAEPSANDIKSAKTVMGYLINYYNKSGNKDMITKYVNMYLQVDPADAAGFSKIL